MRRWLRGMGLGLAVGAALPSVAQTAFQLAPAPSTAQASWLQRDAIEQPARYRAIVVPGSGCASMAVVADRYFAALLHAQITLLQKPHVDPAAVLTPTHCSDAFIDADTLDQWLASAADAVARSMDHAPSTVPVVLIGISEGVELLPHLAPRLPHLALLVLVAHPGMDPSALASRQFERVGAGPQWSALVNAAQHSTGTDQRLNGRSARYWRTLHTWPVQAPLMALDTPVIRAWGDADALLPPKMWEGFPTAPQRIKRGWCDLRFAEADHGLQSSRADHLPTVWAVTEAVMRTHQSQSVSNTALITLDEANTVPCP